MWKVDLLVILALQGFGLAAGFTIHSFSFPELRTYLYAIPAVALGVVSMVLAWRVSKNLPAPA